MIQHFDCLAFHSFHRRVFRFKFETRDFLCWTYCQYVLVLNVWSPQWWTAHDSWHVQTTMAHIGSCHLIWHVWSPWVSRPTSFATMVTRITIVTLSPTVDIWLYSTVHIWFFSNVHIWLFSTVHIWLFSTVHIWLIFYRKTNKPSFQMFRLWSFEGIWSATLGVIISWSWKCDQFLKKKHLVKSFKGIQSVTLGVIISWSWKSDQLSPHWFISNRFAGSPHPLVHCCTPSLCW